MQEGLPIVQIKSELDCALASPSPRVLLKAPTGSGKSTWVPPHLIREGWGERGLVVVVQPRRMAARLLAGYVAATMGETLGGGVGYVVRFERKMSSRTSLVFVTDGMLERWLTDNPELKGISAVIFDEFHERRLSGDISLGRVLDLQESTRSDLAVIVMSATLEISGLADYMGSSCHLLEAEGRTYSVDVGYIPPAMKTDGRGRTLLPDLWEQATDAAREAARHDDCGDILVFMPGVYEIRRTVELLESKSCFAGWDVFPLYGALPPHEQNRAVEKGSKPRIIVSTNVAETSLTIEGVRTVIDAGVARHAGWDSRRGMNTLFVEKIARSSADQRAGRAGRLAPGRCIRLWSEADHARRAEFEIPEVLRVDLSGVILTLKYWGILRPESFRWLTFPLPETLERAVNLLHSLGALDDEEGLTLRGERMLSFPLHPRHARLIIAGEERGCLAEMAAIVSLVESEGVAMKGGLDESFIEKGDYTDFQSEWRALSRAGEANFSVPECTRFGIVARAAREVMSSYRQLLSIGLKGEKLSFLPEPDFITHEKCVTQGILEGFADHVGVRNGIAANTCKLVGGKGGKLAPRTAAYRGMVFVASELSEVGGKNVETKVSRCTSITQELLQELFPGQCCDEDVPVYDDSKRRVLLRRRVVFRGLVLSDQEKGDASPSQSAEILAAKVADGTLKLSKWDDQVDQWIRRMNGLKLWMPELELPGFSEDDAIVAMSMVCEGAVGYKDIKDRDVMPVLREWLSSWQREALDRYAPTSISLSNGRTAKVRYSEDGSPVIALKVQHLFGVNITPRIANGNKAVKVEILAPNQRAWQITASLESFWETGYPQMKKDLAGRYPRHDWP